MADEGPANSASEQPFNVFNNDGSFMEQFRRLQEKQKEEKNAQSSSFTRQATAKPTLTAATFTPAALSTKRVTKSGAVIMKLSGVKKNSAPSVKLKRPPAALRGDSSSEDEEDTTGASAQKLFKLS